MSVRADRACRRIFSATAGATVPLTRGSATRSIILDHFDALPRRHPAWCVYHTVDNDAPLASTAVARWSPLHKGICGWSPLSWHAEGEQWPSALAGSGRIGHRVRVSFPAGGEQAV